jgi:hypothetical protein
MTEMPEMMPSRGLLKAAIAEGVEEARKYVLAVVVAGDEIAYPGVCCVECFADDCDLPRRSAEIALVRPSCGRWLTNLLRTVCGLATRPMWGHRHHAQRSID